MIIPNVFIPSEFKFFGWGERIGKKNKTGSILMIHANYGWNSYAFKVSRDPNRHDLYKIYYRNPRNETVGVGLKWVYGNNLGIHFTRRPPDDSEAPGL